MLVYGLAALNAALAVFYASIGIWWTAVSFTALAGMLLGAGLRSAEDSPEGLRIRDVLPAVRDRERPARERIGIASVHLALCVLVFITTLRILGAVD